MKGGQAQRQGLGGLRLQILLLCFPSCVKRFTSDLPSVLPLLPPRLPPLLFPGTASFRGTGAARNARDRDRGVQEQGLRQPARNNAALVRRSFSRQFYSYRDTGRRGREKFQRCFTCKRIFPLRVSRLNNTPCVSGTVYTADLAMFSACRVSTGNPVVAWTETEAEGGEAARINGFTGRILVLFSLRLTQHPFQIQRENLEADLGNEMGWTSENKYTWASPVTIFI